MHIIVCEWVQGSESWSACVCLAGGLTENDFILAAKINALSFVDLLPKKKPKFWA